MALCGLLTICLIRGAWLRLRGGSLAQRAFWMHECGVLVSGGMGIRIEVRGTPPRNGLIVANHLSYLDIVVFAAAAPCFLVSKAQIRSWPFFGILARMGGTIFVDRSSRASAESVTTQIEERLNEPAPVLFFPEGTSTDGSALLRFHSRFFMPALEAQKPVTSAAVRYVPEDGSPEREVCWFGDAAFLPHLWKVLGSARITAKISFSAPQMYVDRRMAARATHAEIEAMRSASASQEISHRG